MAPLSPAMGPQNRAMDLLNPVTDLPNPVTDLQAAVTAVLPPSLVVSTVASGAKEDPPVAVTVAVVLLVALGSSSFLL